MQVKIKTIIFTALQFISYVAVFLVESGLADTQEWAKTVVLVAAGLITFRNWWMNNSFTNEAIAADTVMDFLKANPDIQFDGITVDEVDE